MSMDHKKLNLLGNHVKDRTN